MTGRKGGLVVLLRGDLLRLGAIVRRPSAGVWVGVVLPAVLLAAGVRAAGSMGSADLQSTQGGVNIGILLGAPIAFVAYGTLFRGGDEPFLRRLGVSAQALFRERALRLLAWGCGLAMLAVIAYSGAGVAVGRVVAIAVPAVAAAWGGALLALSMAARAVTRGDPGKGWEYLTAGLRDSEMRDAAPLIYAPLLPLVAAPVAGGVVAGVAAPAIATALMVGASLAATALAGRAYVEALPRFGPRALEMSFAPRPSGGADGLRVRRGLARLLPRRAGAAWARDGAVAGRRFAWASRVTWPVVIFSLVALARWGGQPAVQSWVAAAAGLVLVLQAAASIGLGRVERQASRWLDRAAGITPVQRFLGRWAWGWGVSLWMAVPLSFAWSWWAAGPGWPWLLVGGGTSGMAAIASGVAAGRR